MAHRTYSLQPLVAWLALSIGTLFLVGLFDPHEKFISHEVYFTDSSASGLAILPASCSSNPSYFHGSLTASGDGLGHISATGQTEYGVTKNSVSLCITNATGVNYFVPTNTAAEMNAVKAVGSSISNLQVW